MGSTEDIGRCLEWQAGRVGGGYGCKGEVLAHRWAWEQVNGPIPPGIVVRHRCDNPLCVRIDHLELGTQRDNILDAVSRGRWGDRSGARNGNAKLTLDQVQQILKEYEHPYRGLGQVLATRYGVSNTTISDIKKRKIWT